MLQLPSKTKPVQHPHIPCVLQDYVAHPNLSTHNMTTLMQPFHCDLQPQIPKHPITAHAQTQRKQLEATATQCGNKKSTETIVPANAAHTRGTFHCGLEPLYTEKHKVSCPNYLPKQSPCNIHAIENEEKNADSFRTASRPIPEILPCGDIHSLSLIA